ncbi:hypothetical protein ACFL6U_31835 [Planctomycetota bacterium]
MTEYKVWIHIEEIDEEKDHYQEIEEPQEAGKFTSEQDARLCADELLNQVNDLCRGLHIEPPPQENNIYRVVYVIDVWATDLEAAARKTYKIMIDPDSLAPVLHVIDPQGHETTIDLSQE